MNITEIKAHDAATLELMIALAKADRAADYAMHEIHDEAGDTKVNRNGTRSYTDRVWQLTDAEAQDKLAAVAADPKTNYRHAATSGGDDSFFAYIGSQAQARLDALREAHEEIARLGAEINALDDVFRANGWARFEAVPGGHIHNRNATCHTLRPTTRVAWVVELSGDTEADAVAQYGPALCSHCFKSAPVEWIQQAKVQKDSEGNVLTLAQAKVIADEKAEAKRVREEKKAAKEARQAARG